MRIFLLLTQTRTGHPIKNSRDITAPEQRQERPQDATHDSLKRSIPMGVPAIDCRAHRPKIPHPSCRAHPSNQTAPTREQMKTVLLQTQPYQAFTLRSHVPSRGSKVVVFPTVNRTFPVVSGSFLTVTGPFSRVSLV